MYLLVSRFNNKLDGFVARAQDPVDALVTLWDQFSSSTIYTVSVYPSKAFSLSSLQDRDEKHTSDSHCTELTLMTLYLDILRLLQALCVVHPETPKYSALVAISPFCFSRT